MRSESDFDQDVQVLMHSYQLVTEEDFQRANAEWGCNCGPSALAVAARVGLDTVHQAIPGFDDKQYTSPSMMLASVENLGRQIRRGEGPINWDTPSLVRIQWEGPWSKPGMNPRWAYRFTHWVAAFGWFGTGHFVFDCNGGMRTFGSWDAEIAPAIMATIPRASGTYRVTHFWTLS